MRGRPLSSSLQNENNDEDEQSQQYNIPISSLEGAIEGETEFWPFDSFESEDNHQNDDGVFHYDSHFDDNGSSILFQKKQQRQNLKKKRGKNRRTSSAHFLCYIKLSHILHLFFFFSLLQLLHPPPL